MEFPQHWGPSTFSPKSTFAILSHLQGRPQRAWKSEKISVRILKFFLKEYSKDEYEAQVNPRTASDLLSATWSYFIHSILQSFMEDVILREAMKEVTYEKIN